MAVSLAREEEPKGRVGIRLRLERSLQIASGATELRHIKQRASAREMHAFGLGIELQGLVEIGKRAWVIALHREFDATGVIHHRVIVSRFRRRVEIRNGAIDFTFVGIRRAAIIIGMAHFRVELQRRAVVGDGSVVVALVAPRLATLHVPDRQHVAVGLARLNGGGAVLDREIGIVGGVTAKVGFGGGLCERKATGDAQTQRGNGFYHAWFPPGC